MRVKHFALNLTADFAKSVLQGFVDLDIEVLSDATQLVLDSRTLTIESVTHASAVCKHELAAANEAYGQKLSIDLPAALHKKGSTGTIRVNYSTSPNASAVQWLPKEQTAGKLHPYLFTQCQAIHARSMFPCQDSPSNKTTYNGTITVPAPLTALMSAASTGSTPSKDGKTTTFTFHQKVPMPSYLVALAIGALEKRDIGPRSAVWSEKEMVEAGAFEFSETEQFIVAAEAIVGDYVWGRYDILLLPPSFPYGGMENPCLTFVTPTLLAGDRSLANVVAHEISHSWMGNLVGCTTWEHFWLNEGFTVFLERKIVQSMYSKQEAHMHALIGRVALDRSLDSFGHQHPYTHLVPKLDGIDPDDAFSSVPYEKGFHFLTYLEGLVGGEAVMNPFLRAHCDKFKYSTTTSEEWKTFFLQYFEAKGLADKLKAIDWDTWFYKPGPPCVTNKFDTSLVDTATALATKLASGADVNIDITGWACAQILVFLDKLGELQKAAGKDKQAFFVSLLQKVDAACSFSASQNAEIQFRFYTLGLRAEMSAVLDGTVALLKSQGRMKFVRPLYR